MKLENIIQEIYLKRIKIKMHKCNFSFFIEQKYFSVIQQLCTFLGFLYKSVKFSYIMKINF